MIGRDYKMMAIALLITAGLAASGCASKGYVNKRVDPLGQRVDSLETASNKQAEELEEVQDVASRADERALSAGQDANEAKNAAEQAGQDAERADRRAGEALSVAESAVNSADALEERIDGLNQYMLVSEYSVLFDFESSRLTAEAQKNLDEMAGALLLDSPYAIEVRGFTDETGGAAYNLALSQRRADAVVRYLATKHDVPLHRIHRIGFGSDIPAADNKTRDGRKKNRRVEVRIYVADREAVSALIH